MRVRGFSLGPPFKKRKFSPQFREKTRERNGERRI